MQADGTPDSKQAFQRWREAMTFAELCALAADFCGASCPAFPGWMASDIDEETDELVPFLSAACERGFLPTASQPGACRSWPTTDSPGPTGFCDRLCPA